MKIKRLEIKGFKSIEHLVLDDVPSLMVLAGSNGTGKSNVVDALRFFSMAISQTVGEAANYFGGWKNIFSWKYESEKPNELFFKIDVIDSLEKEFSYELNIKSTSKKSMITYEILKNISNNEIIFDRKPKPEKIKSNDEITTNTVAGLLIGGLLGALFSSDEKKGEGLATGALLGGLTGISSGYAEEETGFKNDLTLFKTLFSQSEFYQFISNLKIFRIDPILAKKSPSFDDETLHENGDNIAMFLRAIDIELVWELGDDDNNTHKPYTQFQTELMEWLEMIIPELQDIRVEDNYLNNSTLIHFKENSCEKPFPAGLISDGTIYTLCILTAILSRSPQHGITIIEEPERGIHPQAIGELIALMREKAQDKHNIILTTHSEAVVRNLELEELYLVRKKDGKTLIKDVKNSKVDKNKIPLDTAWLSNLFGGGLPW